MFSGGAGTVVSIFSDYVKESGKEKARRKEGREERREEDWQAGQ